MTIHLTFDQDWAPAWATRAVHQAVLDARLRATLFVTHACPTLDELRAGGRFELGWHPNFLPGSSHGETTGAVLDTMAALVPEATGARAHQLMRGTPLLVAYKGRGLRYDAADLHDGVPDLAPFHSWTNLIRLPIFFEDDVHLLRERPCALSDTRLNRNGLKIFNFHPVLLALNARSLEAYSALKRSLATRGVPLTEATEQDFKAFENTSHPGVRDLFESLLAFLQAHPAQAGAELRTLVPVDRVP